MLSERSKLWVRLAVSGLVFAAVLLWVNWGHLLDVVRGLQSRWLLAALAAWLAYLFANAVTASALLAGRTSAPRLLRVNLISSYFALFLPGDAVAGVASRLRYLALPSWRDVAVLTLGERSMQFLVTGFLATLLYPISGFNAGLGQVVIVVPIAIAIAGLLIWLGLTNDAMRRHAATLLSRLGVGESGAFRPQLSLAVLAAATGSAGLGGLTAYFALRSFNAEITYADAFIFSFITGIAQLLPFFFAGIGIRDVTAIGVLGLLGVSKEVALASAAFGLGLVVVAGAVGGVLQVLEERAR
jgi:uncharacterized membrane protein YbhN (UPF0104 family)